MSRGRRATNQHGNSVTQHAKLPPRKKPGGRQLNALVSAAKAVTDNLEGATPAERTYLKFLVNALAPFVRYADGEGKDIR